MKKAFVFPLPFDTILRGLLRVLNRQSLISSSENGEQSTPTLPRQKPFTVRSEMKMLLFLACLFICSATHAQLGENEKQIYKKFGGATGAGILVDPAEKAVAHRNGGLIWTVGFQDKKAVYIRCAKLNEKLTPEEVDAILSE